MVTIAHLAILPGWNSLDSVRRAHSELEAAGLVSFLLLVVMEALAHNSTNEQRKHLFDSIGIWFFAIAIFCEIGGYWYGQRNDDLSQEVISTLDSRAQDAADKASKAVADSNDAETKSSGALDKAGTAQEKVAAVAKRAEDIDADLARTQYLLSGRSVVDPDSLVKQLRQYKGQTDLPPIFVHVRIRQLSSVPSPVSAGMGEREGQGTAFESLAPRSAM